MKQLLVIVLAIVLCVPSVCCAVECEQVVTELNRQLPQRIDEAEVVGILRSLNATNGKKLPPRYVNKRRAHEAGWRPGQDLWQVHGLQGKSIGGDRFINREGQLPNVRGIWREADLDYKGGRRNSKRLLYAQDAPAFITVDHYKTFKEIPACK